MRSSREDYSAASFRRLSNFDEGCSSTYKDPQTVCIADLKWMDDDAVALGT